MNQMMSHSSNLSSNADPITFGIIGSGWRTEFYLRIAKALPQRFRVCGVVTRTEERGKEVEAAWGAPTFRTIEEMLNQDRSEGSPIPLDFVVVSVPWPVAPGTIQELATRSIPVLTETPPAPDLAGLIALNKFAATTPGAIIQVAEQYHLQPLHAARIALVNSGKLGEISQVQLSVCHGYHGISLIRKLLGIEYENAEISAIETRTPIVAGSDRNGPPQAERMTESRQVIAQIRFNTDKSDSDREKADDKLAIFDFSDDQYFSWIRGQRLLVRGSHGEMIDKTVRYLKDYRTPITADLHRENAGEDGNLEGFYLKGILLGEEWLYHNPTIPGRLTDDEIAIADCLIRMHEHVHGGPSFYSLAEASQDHYLSLMMAEAVRTGGKVLTETQPWKK